MLLPAAAGARKSGLSGCRAQVFGLHFSRPYSGCQCILECWRCLAAVKLIQTSRCCMPALADSWGPHHAGDKYSVFLIPDPERLELSSGQEQQQRERAAFRIVPSKYAVPAQAPNWQVAIAVLLLVFAAGTSFQTGLVANTATLPQVLVMHQVNREHFLVDGAKHRGASCGACSF